MKGQELSTIKEYQKDFEKKFGTRLHIDFPAMKGLSKAIEFEEIDTRHLETPEQLLKKCLIKYKADIKIIRNKSLRITRSAYPRENSVLKEFSKLLINGRNTTMFTEMDVYNVSRAAELLNKDRTNIYYYAGVKRRRNKCVNAQ